MYKSFNNFLLIHINILYINIFTYVLIYNSMYMKDIIYTCMLQKHNMMYACIQYLYN